MSIWSILCGDKEDQIWCRSSFMTTLGSLTNQKKKIHTRIHREDVEPCAPLGKPRVSRLPDQIHQQDTQSVAAMEGFKLMITTTVVRLNKANSSLNAMPAHCTGEVECFLRVKPAVCKVCSKFQLTRRSPPANLPPSIHLSGSRRDRLPQKSNNEFLDVSSIQRGRLF